VLFDLFKKKPAQQVIQPKSNVPLSMQERYWCHLIQLKFDEVFVSRYLQQSERWDTRINASLALISATSVSTWALWQKYDLVWAAIIMASQILTVLKPYLPFKKRIDPLKAAGFAYEEIFLKAESKWHTIAEGEISDKEINDLLFELKSEQSKSWKKIAGDISLPDDKNLRRAADRTTGEYFLHNYNMTVTIRI